MDSPERVRPPGSEHDPITGDRGVVGTREVVPAAGEKAQASATAATNFCSVSLASPKSMVVLGS